MSPGEPRRCPMCLDRGCKSYLGRGSTEREAVAVREREERSRSAIHLGKFKRALHRTRGAGDEA